MIFQRFLPPWHFKVFKTGQYTCRRQVCQIQNRKHLSAGGVLGRLEPKAQVLEELPDQGLALRGEDIPGDLALVHQLLVVHDVEQGPAAAGLVGAGPDDHPIDPRLFDRPGAHGAGLQGAVEGAAVEAPVPDDLSRPPDRRDLRVGEGRVVGVPAVVAPADDPAMVDDDGADRHLPQGHGLFRLAQGFPHVLFIW